MRVGIYVRVSTSQQEDGTSLSTQEERCRAAVKLSGYDVVEEFVWHESWTGADLERPMLDRMRRAMREGVVDAVFRAQPRPVVQGSPAPADAGAGDPWTQE